MITMNRIWLLMIFMGTGFFGQALSAAEKPAILVFSSGVDGVLADDLDAGLRNALVALEQNGLSLGDAGERDLAAANLIYQVLMSRMHMQMDVGQVPGMAPGPPVSMQLTVHGNSGASVQKMAIEFDDLMHLDPKLGSVLADHPGLYKMRAQKGQPNIYGGRMNVAGKPAMVLGVNRMPGNAEPDLSGFGLPEGASLNMGLQVNFSSMGPLFQALMSMNPMASSFNKGLELAGLTGPDAMDISLACGSTTDGSVVMSGHVTNLMKHYGSLVPSTSLTPEDLRALPKDASVFDIQKVNLSAIPDFIDKLVIAVAPPGQFPEVNGKPMSPVAMGTQMARMFLGIDLKTQFFDYLGDTVAIYRSDSTGGGGLFSLTALVKLSNAKGMQESMSTIASTLDITSNKMSKGYVRLVQWSADNDLPMITLAFPGLPVPVQVSCCISGDYLVLGMTPESVHSAIAQMNASESVLDNKAFRATAAFDGRHIQRMQFLDTGARLSNGYGITAGLMTAIGNYARPMRGASASIDTVMPAYGTLANEVRPVLLRQVVDGDDLVFTGSGHRSVVSHVTAIVGEISSSPVLIGSFAVGLIAPAISNAREAARITEDMAELRNLYVSMVKYSMAHEGHLPGNLHDLIGQDGINDALIHRVRYYPDSRKLDLIPQPQDRMILSMVTADGNFVVAFADGHIRKLDWDQFAEMEKQFAHGEHPDHEHHHHDHGHGHDH